MADPAPPALIELADVAVKRGGRIVVAGVTVAIWPGRAYVLRGANGSGKTSLLRVIGGLARPASGKLVMTNGAAAFLGHADGVKGALTARENLDFWKTLYRATDERAARATATLRIEPFLRQAASTLSAGQRRRLALCRVAMSGRSLWLLDEPTAGVDAASIRSVIAMIDDHCAQGGAAMVATHEPLAFQNAVDITLSEEAA